MSRFVRAAALGVIVAGLVLSSAVYVHAESSQFPGPSQSITGSTGYTYSVPADWQQVSNSLQKRTGDQLLVADGEALSADGQQLAHVETVTNLGVTPDRLADALAGYLSIGQGGPASGAAPVVAISGPDSVQVTHADSAVSGAISYKDPSGAERVVAARLAVRTGTTFVLTLDVTKDFYQSDPAFGAIMNSFQLP
jgi:hypothetical protein